MSSSIRSGQAIVDIAAELAAVTDHWTPRIVGRVNDQYVKVAKLLGELVWHAHEAEDELFQVVYGDLVIQLRETAGSDVITEVRIGPGQFFTVPQGMQHNPVAHAEVGIVLVETLTTAHTGAVQSDRTVAIDRQLGGAQF